MVQKPFKNVMKNLDLITHTEPELNKYCSLNYFAYETRTVLVKMFELRRLSKIRSKKI